MGRRKLNSYPVNCRVSRKAGDELEPWLEILQPSCRKPGEKKDQFDARWKKRRPIGTVLSRLIENAPDDLWVTAMYKISDWNGTYPNSERWARFQR